MKFLKSPLAINRERDISTRLKESEFISMLENINDILTPYRDECKIDLSIANPSNVGYSTKISDNVQDSLIHTPISYWGNISIEIFINKMGLEEGRSEEIIDEIRNRLNREYDDTFISLGNKHGLIDKIYNWPSIKIV